MSRSTTLESKITVSSTPPKTTTTMTTSSNQLGCRSSSTLISSGATRSEDDEEDDEDDDDGDNASSGRLPSLSTLSSVASTPLLSSSNDPLMMPASMMSSAQCEPDVEVTDKQEDETLTQSSHCYRMFFSRLPYTCFLYLPFVASISIDVDNRLANMGQQFGETQNMDSNSLSSASSPSPPTCREDTPSPRKVSISINEPVIRFL